MLPFDLGLCSFSVHRVQVRQFGEVVTFPKHSMVTPLGKEMDGRAQERRSLVVASRRQDPGNDRPRSKGFICCGTELCNGRRVGEPHQVIGRGDDSSRTLFVFRWCGKDGWTSAEEHRPRGGVLTRHSSTLTTKHSRAQC